MSNVVPCPSCGEHIDAVQASLQNECYECQTYFGDLLSETPNDPAESGPYYEVEE